VVALAYFGLHQLGSQWLGLRAAGSPPAPVLVAWVLACFGLLFVVQAAVRAFPRGMLARRLYPWLFAGLYLDELFTRLTFRVWPVRRPTGAL
jgi:NAD(P)H-quinone oxidoreductase subunit 5